MVRMLKPVRFNVTSKNSVLSLSLSFPVKGVSQRPNPFQEVPEASGISYKQTSVMNSQELDSGSCGALLGR